jgi:hypothetical protein
MTAVDQRRDLTLLSYGGSFSLPDARLGLGSFGLSVMR